MRPLVVVLGRCAWPRTLLLELAASIACVAAGESAVVTAVEVVQCGDTRK